MTLKETFDSFRTDLRELKAAAQAHNVASYEPPTSAPEKASSTPDKPSSSSSSSPKILPSPSAPATKAEPTATFIPPPPPPKNLPHGWTARYDKKESKFCYSHGVDSKKEQWDFPTEELTQEPSTRKSAV